MENKLSNKLLLLFYLDRFKCPLHGPVIPRNSSGVASESTGDHESSIQARASKHRDVEKSVSNEDWQDPELLNDLRGATGVDLKVKKQTRGKGVGKNTKKNKQQGLTNITEMKNTPRARIEKKLFNRSSMKRIAEKMDTLESKKFKDKFADQFNYMYNA